MPRIFISRKNIDVFCTFPHFASVCCSSLGFFIYIWGIYKLWPTFWLEPILYLPTPYWLQPLCLLAWPCLPVKQKVSFIVPFHSMSSTNLRTILQICRNLQTSPLLSFNFHIHFWKLYNLNLCLCLDCICPLPPSEDADRDTLIYTENPYIYWAGSGPWRVSSWVTTHWMCVRWSPQFALNGLWSPAHWAHGVSHMPANQSFLARYSNGPRPSCLPKAWSSQKLHFVLIPCH